MTILRDLAAAVTDILQQCKTTPYEVFLGLSLIVAVYQFYDLVLKKEDMPIYGAKGPFAQTRTRLLANFTCSKLLQQGYTALGPLGKPFKIRMPGRDLVIVTHPADIDQLKTVDGSILSFDDAILDLSVHYTVGKAVLQNPYHIPIISKSFTQHLSSMLPAITAELAGAFEENTSIGSEWTEIATHDVMTQVISRTSNLVLVGAPLCRDKTYLDVLTAFSTKALVAGMTVDMAPDMLKPLLARLLINRESALASVQACLTPLFDARRAQLEKSGPDWPDRPKDAAQWILESAPDKSDYTDMTARIILLNFAAIHTSTLSILQILYDLAAHNHHIEPVRLEIESALREAGGWTVGAIAKMRLLDSVIRESLRLNSVLTATAVRRSRVPFTFASGTTIPAGTTVAAPAYPVHQDPALYDSPLAFDGFRHARLRDADAGAQHKHQATSATSDYLVFGLGKHACPGRFFVVNELKILTAYLVCNYEFRLPGKEGVRPGNVFFSFSCAPDTKVRMSFRRRKEWGESAWRECGY
ncbi:cytochrome P450 [Geopyxis carbonaria]|nr:cytochrome P450 [Geopyxis carbonaria]